jgi:hypothetical protein
MRFRPLPLPELLDELFRIYRRHFIVIIGVTLVVALPGLVWQLVTGNYKLTATSYTNLFTTPTGGATTTVSSAQLSNLLGSLRWAVLGGLILLPFSVGAVYQAVTNVALGRPATVGSVLRETLSHYWRLFGFIALAGVLILVWAIVFLIGLVLVVLPGLAVFGAGVYLGIRWSLSLAAMMAEEIGPIKALRRSWNLVKGQWWRTFGILLIVAILSSVITYALTIVVALISAALGGGDVQLAAAAVLSTLLGAAVSPIWPIAITLLYFDLRVRKEGLDLDQLAQQSTPGPAPA